MRYTQYTDDNIVRQSESDTKSIRNCGPIRDGRRGKYLRGDVKRGVLFSRVEVTSLVRHESILETGCIPVYRDLSEKHALLSS